MAGAMAPDHDPAASASAADAIFARGIEGVRAAASFDAFDQAASLIAEAADLGHAEAIATLATFEAVGAGRERNWNRAFILLREAAGLGSERAAGQLALLARLGGPVDAIDVEGLLRAPSPSLLSERPLLRVFRGFASPAECEWVIQRLGPKLHAAQVWDATSGEGVVDPYRSNSAAEVLLTEMDVVLALLKARIATATRLPEFLFEVPQLMHYAVGEEFRPHHDYLDPAQPGFAADLARRGQRMGTLLIFLNEDYEGGETEFPEAGISFRGRTGDALFFANIARDGRPDPLTLHAGRAPTKGEKWIISQWIRERPPPG